MSIDAQALDIFDALLDIVEPQARAAFIDRRCGGDHALRARVQRMIDASTTAPLDFEIETNASKDRKYIRIPRRIGPWRVIEVIARGGMGTVVKARRDDGIYDQTVAIKLIRSDRTSAATQDRFDTERRILARLMHPGVVRILDGGDVDGSPWLAMDYVDGLPITEMLARLGADFPARIAAFEHLCDAITYAHRALVIHADIKPSNVLMTAEGDVRVVDFGISRMIEPREADSCDDPHPLTRGYAAPECAAGMAPTIASDVFSLGVLMAEILTGKAIDARQLSLYQGALTVTHDDALRAPCGRRFGGSRTSSRPRHDVPASHLRALLAENRQNAVLMSHSQRTLVLPLAAIIDRATAHEPAARYPDVPALLADIRRYRAHIPVSAIARPPWRYVTQSFLRRHRAGAMITGAVLAIMAVATTISTVQYVRAERALDEADARFADARGAANYLIFNLQDRLDTVPRSVQLRRESVGVAQHYLNRLAQSAMPASTGLRAETAAGLVRLAEAEGVPGKPNIDAPDLARRDLDHALALLAGGSDARSVDLQILALTDRAHLADYAENRNDQAMHDSDGAMALAATHRDGNALIRARMLAEHADVLAWHDDWRGSDEAANQALGVLGTDRGLEATLLRGAIADDHANAAEALHRHDDAVRQFQAAIAIFADATRRFGQSWRARRELAREQWLLGANAVDHHPDARSLALLDAAEQGFAALARDDGDDQDIPRLIRYVRADRARTLSAMGLDREAQEILTALIADDRAQVLRHPGERQWLRDLIIDLGLAGTARSAMAGLRKAARSIANSMPRSPGFRRWETNMACH